MLYGYMQNHRNGIEELVAYCMANQTEAFGNLTVDDVAPMFLFDFGNLTAAEENVTVPANETVPV